MKFKKIKHNYKVVKNFFDIQFFVKQNITNVVMRYIKQNFNFKFIDILTYFRNKTPDTLIQIQNIYNVKKKIQHRKLKKYIFIQLLLKALYQNK